MAKKFLPILLLLLFCGFAKAETNANADTDLKRQFIFSTAYIEKLFNSNQGLLDFPLSVLQAYSKLFDHLSREYNDNWSARALAALIDMPVSFWLANSLFVPFHEFGHARILRATGGNYSFGSMAYGQHWRGVPNYWALAALRFITPPFFFAGSGGAYCVGILKRNAIALSLRHYWGKDGDIIISASAGLNNQMLLAKHIGRLIYEHNGHFTYLQSYVGNKISAFAYSQGASTNNLAPTTASSNTSDTNDVRVILKKYRDKNYAITNKDIKIQSLLSLLSGTTFSLLRSYYSYLVNADPIATPLELFGLRVFDINSYINARGLSFEIETDYRITSALSVGLAYEFIWKGERAHNFTPRVRYDLASFWPVLHKFCLSAEVIIADQKNSLAGSLKLDYAPKSLEYLGVLADFTIYNAHTLYGERNITSLRHQKISAPELNLGFYLRY